MAGSPPLAREQLAELRTIRDNNRITPACAGTTGRPVRAGLLRRDHPRLRGNNVHPKVTVLSHSGSPPLAREQLLFGINDDIGTGITPACAGTTDDNGQSLPEPQDHPRLRGNNMMEKIRYLSSLGSPPLAREQPFGRKGIMRPERITPACAGTTYCHS